MKPFRMNLGGPETARYRAPVRLASLSECAGEADKGVVETVPDGGCTWSRSHGQRHGKHSDRNASNSVAYKAELAKLNAVGVGVRRAKSAAEIERDRRIVDLRVRQRELEDENLFKNASKEKFEGKRNGKVISVRLLWQPV